MSDNKTNLALPRTQKSIPEITKLQIGENENYEKKK